MVAKQVIFIIGAVVLLAAFSSFFMTYLNGNFTNALNTVKQLFQYRRMDITSPEQLEQLLLCLHERAAGCSTVEKGIWTKLEGTPFENCPCGGKFMAGTDVFVTFKFKNKKKITLPQKNYAGFDIVKEYGLKCNARITDSWLEKLAHLITAKAKYLLFYNPNEDQEPLTIYNDSNGIVVVNTRTTLGDKMADLIGVNHGSHLRQGCIVIQKK